MKTTYKIISVQEKVTTIYEYWDDILIYKYTVFEVYKGGDIEHFIKENDILRAVIWEGLEEFHKRTMILDN